MSNHKVNPQVKIISKPENMLQTIYTACRTCYSADSPININESESANDPEKALKLVKRVISSGHYSTIEHIQVSYAISGISRACSHQFVRHRLMSFSQKSQRYVQEKDQFDYIVPTSFATQRFQCPNVCSVIYQVGWESVVETVTRQKCYLVRSDSSDCNSVTRFAVRSFHVDFFNFLSCKERIETCSANNTDCCFFFICFH